MSPMPPNCRATSGPHPRRPKCKRLGVRIWRRCSYVGGRPESGRKSLTHGRIVNVAV